MADNPGSYPSYYTSGIKPQTGYPQEPPATVQAMGNPLYIRPGMQPPPMTNGATQPPPLYNAAPASGFPPTNVYGMPPATQNSGLSSSFYQPPTPSMAPPPSAGPAVDHHAQQTAPGHLVHGHQPHQSIYSSSVLRPAPTANTFLPPSMQTSSSIQGISSQMDQMSLRSSIQPPQTQQYPPPQMSPMGFQQQPLAGSTVSQTPQLMQQQQQGTIPQDQSSASKLNPSAMPRPCALESLPGAPRTLYQRHSASPGAPPLTSADYIGIDEGSAIPRFMRVTTGCIGKQSALQLKSGIPFGALASPFSDVAPGEYQPRVVDMRTEYGGGPLRCMRCKGYANPGFRFMNGGQKFVCNICHHTNDTPPNHVCAIDPGTGLRTDLAIRPEFQFGSVDYLVGSEDYRIRKPRPASYVFILDVSSISIESGLFQASLSTFKFLFENASQLIPGADAGATVSIVTYDRALHFYDCRVEEGGHAKMLYVADVDDPFVPIGGDGFFFSPKQALAAINTIASTFRSSPVVTAVDSQHPQGGSMSMSSSSSSSSSCMGAALQVAQMALKSFGGKVFLFGATLPNIGVGKLERRAAGAAAVASSEEKEMEMMKPSSDFYENLGNQMSECHISTDIFIAGTLSQVDLATIFRLPKHCGGQSIYYHGYTGWRDGDVFARELVRAVSSVRAFEAMARIRVSSGLDTIEYFGHFGRPLKSQEMNCGVLGTESTLACTISHETNIDDGSNTVDARSSNVVNFFTAPCIQIATLYTDPTGQRRIRVHTFFFTTTTNLPDIFKAADVDCVLALLTKRAAQAIVSGNEPIAKVRDSIISKSIHMLYVYRKFCATSASSGQLILPEALKILPVSVLGLVKSIAFAQPTTSFNERVAALFRIGWAGPASIAAYAYPRLYSLGDMPPEAGVRFPPIPTYKLDESFEPIALPPSVPACRDHMLPNRVMLIDGGFELCTVIGDQVDPEVISSCFVVKEYAQQNGTINRALFLRGTVPSENGTSQTQDPYAERVQKVVERVIEKRFGIQGVHVFNLDQAHLVRAFIEDKGGNAGFSLGYVEMLKFIHRKIMDLYSSDSIPKELLVWEKLSQGYD